MEPKVAIPSRRINSQTATCALLSAVLLAGCTTNEVTETSVASQSRPAADVANDPGRKPAETLRFFDIKPGSDVLDVFGGGGYYAELLSSVVGPDGSVVLYNNDSWDRFVGGQVRERLKNDRLPNVEYLVGGHDVIPRARYDSAIFVLGMHDLYYENPDNGWARIDRPAFLTSVFLSLKPGGRIGVIDHNAAPGSGASVAKSLHRIDPELMTADLRAAGFRLVATSTHLRNPEDDHSQSVFDPSLRWSSDRSVMLFERPR